MIERESETIDTQLGFWFEVGGRYACACLLFFMLNLALMTKMVLSVYVKFDFRIERKA